MRDEHLLSVIIRFHDHRKFAELQRCLFSLINSTYTAIQAVVVCQNIPSSQAQRITDYVKKLNAIKSLELLLLTPEIPVGVDSRSLLLNLGMQVSGGRYLAFLDYDDSIYPNAYALLIRELQASNSTIAFGDIAITHAYVQDGVTIVRRKSKGWGIKNLADLLLDNCSPIHGYVFDRAKMTAPFPTFDETLTKYEDYDFLLSICTRYRSSFNASAILVGDYYIKEDGSNTVITSSSYSPQAHDEWEKCKNTVLTRRDRTQVSDTVLDQLKQYAALAGVVFSPASASVRSINEVSRPLRRLNTHAD